MTRLPAVRRLADDIRTARRGKNSVGASADYLVDNRTKLMQFDNFEHLALCTEPEYALPNTTPEQLRDARPLSHHIVEVRAELARALWSRQFFVDTEVLDELIFYSALDANVADPVLAVLEWIRDSRATRPGLMIFPLHSFGVVGAGLLRPSVGRISFVNAAGGYALSPQTNNLQRTLAFLEETRRAFKVKKRLPTERLEHWRRSRPTKWLENNPLLVMRTVQLPGSYYANEWLLVSRVRATTALLGMLAALQPPSTPKSGLFSTRTMNNWQTLDIHHYITLFNSPGERHELAGFCVPIHASRVYVSELSDLEIDIDPSHWRRTPEVARRVHAAVESLYSAYLHQRFSTAKANARTRTVRKLFDSLSFFRRSYQQTPGDWSAKVNLATAFEMLLTDSWKGVTAALPRRTRLLLTGVRGTRAMQAAVSDLYRARSALVHTGSDAPEVDMDLARKAFVLCFVRVVERLDSIAPTSATPLRDAIGDVAADPA